MRDVELVLISVTNNGSLLLSPFSLVVVILSYDIELLAFLYLGTEHQQQLGLVVSQLARRLYHRHSAHLHTRRSIVIPSGKCRVEAQVTAIMTPRPSHCDTSRKLSLDLPLVHQATLSLRLLPS